MVDEHGAHPFAQGHLSRHALNLIQRSRRTSLTVQAAVGGSYARALEALAVHPLVGSEPLAKAILDDYLEAHGDLLSHIRGRGD